MTKTRTPKPLRITFHGKSGCDPHSHTLGPPHPLTPWTPPADKKRFLRLSNIRTVCPLRVRGGFVGFRFDDRLCLFQKSLYAALTACSNLGAFQRFEERGRINRHIGGFGTHL